MPDSSGSSYQSSGEPQGPSSNEFTPDVAGRPDRQNIPSPASSSRIHQGRAAADKVWIPRASPRLGPPSRARTKHACEACRRRRIKCDGGRPVCQGCAAAGTECVYADHKRVRDRQELSSMKATLDQYEQLLRDLVQEVPASAAKRIRSILTPAVASPSEHIPSVSSSSASSAGSLDGIDTINEDLNRTKESRATGFMGKNSVHAWMRRIESDNALRGSPDQSEDTVGRSQFNRAYSPQSLDSNAGVSYFLDDKQLPTLKPNDLFELPPKTRADWILWSYFKYIHPFFPIVRANLFLDQYKSLWAENSPRPGRKWLAIFNMILAIGCRQLQFLQEPLPDDVDDSRFFARARELSINENMTLEHADLQQVQVEALVTLYFMVSMQINRAWKVSGIAVRSAMALAINLRITNTQLHHASKEARSRLWWSIYMLENLLSHMTGRPTCIGSSSFSVDQPIPFTEDLFEHPQVIQLLKSQATRKDCLNWSLDEQDNGDNVDSSWLQSVEPNQGLQFFYLVDLMHIAHIAIAELFSPTGFQASRSYIKRRIRFYDEKIDQWLSRLHPAFRFVDEQDKLSLQTPSQEQIVLALHYYSARITLYRPCSPFRRHPGPKEKEYNNISRRCLEAAMSLISVFPDIVDVEWIYKLSPWWCILHFLMQAGTILIIFSQRVNSAEHTNDPFQDSVDKEKSLEIQNGCRKAHSWLHGLSGVDESFRRAFLLFDGLVKRLGLLKSFNTHLSDSLQRPLNNATYNPNSATNGSGQPTHVGYQPQPYSPKAADAATEQENATGEILQLEMESSMEKTTTNGDTSGAAALAEFEDMEDISDITRDLMTNNYTQWIRAALEDGDIHMELS